MLAKRIIPCLDVKDGRTVKGVNFVDLRDAGDAVSLAARYAAEGADELVFLDITATVEKRKTLVALVEQVSKQLAIPFTVGGGVRSVEDARALLYAGADKIAVNSAAVRRPELLSELAAEFGSQAVVLAIDAKQEGAQWRVYLDGGRSATEIDVLDWAYRAQELGAGELLLTSMDHDGVKQGFALALLEAVAKRVRVPIIASGGAGSAMDFVEVFSRTSVDAALAASIFHFSEVEIPQLKSLCQQHGIVVRR